MQLLSVAKDVFNILEQGQIPYALVGGLAVGIHGHIRATQDIDIVIASPKDYLELSKILNVNNWIENSKPIPLANNDQIHRWLKNIDDNLFILDVMLTKNAQAIIAQRERLELDGTECWVINKPMLIDMKRLAGREQDLADAKALES